MLSFRVCLQFSSKKCLHANGSLMSQFRSPLVCLVISADFECLHQVSKKKKKYVAFSGCATACLRNGEVREQARTLEPLSAAWIPHIPPTLLLCRPLMFICSAHLGLVTKHLLSLPACMWAFHTAMTVKERCCPSASKEIRRGSQDFISRTSGLILQT